MKLLITLIALALTIVNSTVLPGPCPTVSLQPNFNITNYLGTWYEVVRNKDMPYEDGICDIAQYGSNPNGTVSVLNSEVRNGVWDSVPAYAYCDASDPAHCHVKFSNIAPAGDYRVISTDYVNYSFVLSCDSNGRSHIEWVWVLARNKNFNYTSFIPQIAALGIPESQLYFTPQKSDGTVMVMNISQEGKWTSAKAFAYCDPTELYNFQSSLQLACCEYENYSVIFNCAFKQSFSRRAVLRNIDL